MTKLSQLKEDAARELRERLEQNGLENIDREPDSEIIHEIADSQVPVYNRELLEMAAEDYSEGLAIEEPDILAFDGKSTAVNAIAGRVFEELSEHLHDTWGELWEEAQEMEDEDESEEETEG
jgi:hypothetical protein